jgi:hypothetical protein
LPVKLGLLIEYSIIVTLYLNTFGKFFSHFVLGFGHPNISTGLVEKEKNLFLLKKTSTE